MSKYAKLDKGYGENALVVHRKASAFAGSKVEGLEKHFSRWVTQDPERYERLVDVYNRTLNGVVAPSYDGSRREIAGISDRYKPYPYQLNAVERMLNEPGVLLNHVVGAGKTGSMLMGAMELKRLGVAKQPWMVVPNHLVEQVGIEAKQWFPGANMLVETRSGSSRKDDRQRLLAQAAANDWELVIVSMSSFGEMSMSADYLRDYRDSVLDEFERDLQEIEDNEVDEQTRRDNTRRIEQKRDKFEQSMNQKIDKISRGDTIPWDQTRGDYIIVDEAHNYKNLRRVSKLADLAEEGSDRATDLDVKLRYLRGEKGSEHPIATFATGTPIANSIAEIYTMLNYLRPDLLHEAGMHGVNSWAQNFTSKRSEIGFTAGNKIKPQTRIASYENLAELAQMCAPMADTITREDIPRKLPSIKGGETTVVEFDVDQETKDLIQDLSWREDNQPDNPKIDNALKIMSDGKNATLSPELANLPPAQGVGRVHAVVQNVVREWQDNKDNEYTDQQGNVSPNRGGLQLIFCDKGVPKPDGSFSMYEAIRDQLVEAGMDKGRIRFIHDWDNKRTQLFDDCNNGKVDVLIANTAKLGTGANIQSRGVAIHHVDVPWRPADLEQQDGRFFRQGNQNDEVARYTYVGRGTYDGHSWATIERKGRFTNQFWNADRSMRSIAPLEDNDLEAMAQNKAIATGNPDFVRKAELTKQVEKLEAAADEHTALAESNVLTRRQAQEDLTRAQRRLDRTEGLVDQAEQWADTDYSKERTWNINHAQQDSREEATSALIDRLKEVKDSRSTDYQPVGTIAGISFAARFDAINGSVQVKSDFGQVGRDAIEKWVIDPTYAHSGITPEEIKNKQSGLLTQLENTVRAAPDRVDQTRADITNYQQTIDDIDQLGDPESFPHQDQLDSARKELNKVTQRLADFDASDAEVRRRQEYASRLASKGRSPGYSLELNPTGFMRDTGMVCHPDSKPISHAAEGTTLPAPPASPELHPGAQESMDFLNGLGLGSEVNNPHSNDYTENSAQTPDEDINLDEEQEDDNGNEL
ncbi:DEAD/DEAH box helicase family protein [Corynebacterium striatum]|uniref:DEAD/DEAH box helicase family protein n=2 Tax=Corynebacteriaceae TaxID=1653 RepID=UPI003B63D600